MSKKLLQEIERRASEKRFSVETYCFDKQLKFISDPARYKTAVCSRRSGKSHACAGDMISTAMKGPFHNVAYITLSRTSAKRIIWPVLQLIIAEFKIPCKMDNTELTIEFKGGSTIYLMGAKDDSEIQKLRGLSLKRVYIDEAQSIRDSILEVLIDDILAYAIMDVNGSIQMIGTPGPIANGYFYSASHNPKWANHKWTIHDNIWIERKSGKTPSALLAEERARKGIDESNPTYRREALAEWVTDFDALVFKFNADKNVYTLLPDQRMEYILGIDLGFHDADAIAVIGFSYASRKAYLVEEVIHKKQDITKLTGQIKALNEKYKPIKMVMDTAGAGKKIAEELRNRHALPIEAADKVRKFEFIELLNGDLRNGHFLVPRNSTFESDCYKIEWDRDNPEKLKVSDRFHSDIADSVLYAWKECKNYLYEKEAATPARNSDAYMEAMERQESEALERKLKTDPDGLTQEDAEFIYADDFE